MTSAATVDDGARMPTRAHMPMAKQVKVLSALYRLLGSLEPAQRRAAIAFVLADPECLGGLNDNKTPEGLLSLDPTAAQE